MLQSFFQKSILLTLDLGEFGIMRATPISKVDTKTASPELLRLSKQLLISPEHAAIRKFDAQLRGTMRKLQPAAASFVKGGLYLIPLAKAGEAELVCESAQSDRAELIEAFVKAYPDAIRDAKSKLGQLFDENDYPENVAGEYYFRFNFMSFGTPDNLPEEIRKRDEARAEKAWTGIVEDVREGMRVAMLQLVDHLTTILQSDGGRGEGKIFRKDSFNRLTEFLEEFAVKNITDDGELAKLVARAQNIVRGAKPETIRESADAKAAVAAKFADLKTTLAGMVTERGKRKFSFD
jgi:hypothetical protein